MSNPVTADDVEALIRDFEKSGMRELHLRCDEFEIFLSMDCDGRGIESAYELQSDPSQSTLTVPDLAVAAAAPVALREQQWPADATVVRAPYLGTFYRSPKPGTKPYVEIGDAVIAEADLCLVEVMKLFTAVRAGTAGRVHAILAKDGQLVEGGQPLFVLVPA